VPWDSTNSTLSLPIHFRYQMPNPSNPYSDILINPSIMLTLCSQTSRPPSPPDTPLSSLSSWDSSRRFLKDTLSTYIALHLLWHQFRPRGPWANGRSKKQFLPSLSPLP
jgi:hypothetical protein